MESLKDYSLKITEQEYHNYPAWSHSMIVNYARNGFSAISTLHDRIAPTPSMEFGSLFDSMLTKGKATLDEYVVSGTVVPPAIKTVLDTLALRTTKPFHEIPSELIEEVMNDCKYQTNWGYKARFSKIAEYEDYYNNLSSGKKVVSREDWDDAAEMYNIFRKDPYLKTLFGTKNTDDVEYIYQAKYVVDYTLDSGKTVNIKFMPDLMVVNHKDKTIQPVDLKTSSVPAYDFKENFLKFRYDIEANLYTCGINIVIDKIPEYQDYKVLPYLFTDISRVDKVPVTYIYDPMDISQEEGLSFESNDRTLSYNGWQKLLEEIIEYEETQAKVPSYIKTDGPNDMLKLLSYK